MEWLVIQRSRETRQFSKELVGKCERRISSQQEANKQKIPETESEFYT
jgi:hypothetical protein